jgi:hypothetical protein
MAKFNVIIPERNRTKYLTLCLSSLFIAAMDKDVKIHIAQEEEITGLFNKSKLINGKLKEIENEIEEGYISIVDVDMIYTPDFFDIIENEVDDKTYLISNGFKLTQMATEEIFSATDTIGYLNINEADLDQRLAKESEVFAYPSQITFSLKLYHKMLDILGTDTLYHEGFEGWGGEDSYLSFFSRYCENAGLLKKRTVNDMWYHLWHPSQNEASQRNLQLFKKLNTENQKKVIEYAKNIP